MDIRQHFTKKEVDEQLATDISNYIRNNYSDRSVVIAVSGGSTPFDMYKILAGKLKSMLEQNVLREVAVIQVDERFVPSTSDRANQKTLCEIFSEPINFFPIIPSDIISDLEDAVRATQSDYFEILRTREKDSIDIILLGMGSDGHTASMFPNNKDYLATRDKKFYGVFGTFVASQDEDRISLSSEFINKSKLKILFAFGDQKLNTLREAIRENNSDKYPILSVTENLQLYTINNEIINEIKELSKED